MSHQAATCGDPYYIYGGVDTWWRMPPHMVADHEAGHSVYPTSECRAVVRWWGVLGTENTYCVQHGENREHRREFDLVPLGIDPDEEWIPFIDPEVTAWLDELHARTEEAEA